MDLLLVSGVGGSGVSTVASGLARALRARGLATAEVNSAVPAPLASSSLWADATGTFGVWLTSMGTATLAPEELAGLAGINELVTGAIVASAVRDPTVDVVVWDLGSVREAGRTLQVLDSVPVLLDRLLTGSVADQLSAPDPAASVAAWYQLVTHVARARDVISSSRCILVGQAGDSAKLEAGAGIMRLFGSRPTALVFNRTAKSKPSRRAAPPPDLPSIWLDERRKSAPKSGWVATRLAVLVEHIEHLNPVSTPAWALTSRAEKYRLTIPLRAGAQVQVGRRGDSLLLLCDGFQRHFELPPVLKRCVIEGGGMRGSELILEFAPDPRLWREQS